MSEKLKEIKRLWHEEDTLDFDSYDWLINQAERVQVLEASRSEIAESFRKTWNENQRYKQALEKIATRKMSVYLNRETMLNDFIKIAVEALEADTQ